MWWKRRKLEGLLAASLYESLPENERNELGRALERSADLRRDAETLRRLSDSIPTDAPTLDVDLVPLLHARLAHMPQPERGKTRFVLATACIAFMVVVAATVFRSDYADPAAPAPGSSSVAGGPPSLLSQAIREADRCIAENQPGRAYEILVAGVKAQPGDPQIQDAQLRLADLAFELARYEEALAAYDKLVAIYYRSGGAEPAQHRVVQRRELLAEAARDDFRPLDAIAIAMRGRDDAIEGLEQVITDNPGTFVADLAAESMGYALMEEIQADDVQTAYLLGMESARTRCESPEAIALLDLKIGDLYRDDFRDFTAAEQYYRKAESSEAPVVAKRATDALGSLPAAN